jgi:hypothetical protein
MSIAAEERTPAFLWVFLHRATYGFEAKVERTRENPDPRERALCGPVGRTLQYVGSSGLPFAGLEVARVSRPTTADGCGRGESRVQWDKIDASGFDQLGHLTAN